MNKIITLPHPSLSQKSARVHFIGQDTTDLIEEMISQALEWEDARKEEVCVGLAAVQINKLIKVIIVRDDFDDRDNRNFIAFINPEIIKYEGQKESKFEGCLSVKDCYANVARYTKIRFKALLPNGQQVKFKADGFLARVLQHEIDHLNGLTIMNRVEVKEGNFKSQKASGGLEPLSLSQIKQLEILPNE